MKNSKKTEALVPKLNSTFNNTFEGMKIGMGVTHDLMSRYPAYKPLAFANDALFNISVSSIAQRKSFGQSVVEWGGGIAAGSVCSPGGVLGSAACGLLGSYGAGQLYDTIARANGYRDASDYISAVEYFRQNPGPSFNESLAYQKALSGLTEGDFTYVNSPYSGLQLFTKENGKILKVAVLPPGIDYSHVRHPNSIQSHSSVSNTSTAIDISIPITSNVSNQGAVVPYVSSSSSNHTVNSRALIVKPPIFPVEAPMRNIVIPSDLEIASSPYVLSRTCNTLGNLTMQHQRAQALSEFIETYENEPWQKVVKKERAFGIKAFTIKKVSHTKPHAGQVEQAKIELAAVNKTITSLQQSMIDETQIAIAEARQNLVEEAERAIVKTIENRESSLVAEYHNILNKVRLDSEGNNAIHITVINADNMEISAQDLIPGQDIYYKGGRLNIVPYGNVVFGERADGYSDNVQKALNLIYYMISKDIDINSQNNKGMTPFMLSCAYGQKYIAKQLILQDSLLDHSKRDNSGFDNFLWAVELRGQGILTKLLQQGLNIDVQDNLGRSSLHRSCLNNYPELIKFILERGADKSLAENDGFYPVHLAASKGNVEALIALAEYDSSLLEQVSINTSGFTPLLCAAQYGQSMVAEYLLSQNVDVNKARADTGATPLHMAIGQKFLDTVSTLLTASDIEKEDNNGENAIMHSLRVQDTEIINLILDRRPNLDHTNHDGITPLLDAIIYAEDAELVHLLLSHGATPSLVSGAMKPINGKDLSGMTPLHISIIKNNAQIVSKLVPVSDLTVEDNNGNTPLLRSLVIGNEEIIKLIIQDNNCNPDATNTAGMTPLLFAVLNSNTPLVDLLITHGANPNLAVGNIPPINGNDFSGWYVLKIFISASNIELTERISIFEKHMTKFTYEVLDDCGFDVQPPVIDTSAHDTELIGQEGLHDLM